MYADILPCEQTERYGYKNLVVVNSLKKCLAIKFHC